MAQMHGVLTQLASLAVRLALVPRFTPLLPVQVRVTLVFRHQNSVIVQNPQQVLGILFMGYTQALTVSAGVY